MKKNIFLFIVVLIIFSVLRHEMAAGKGSCFTGAFLADKPGIDDILKFKDTFSKAPYLVMVFCDWSRLIDDKVIEGIYSQGCVLFVSWEPWDGITKKAIDYDALLAGQHDEYIRDFALKLKNIDQSVYLRFAHEVNGNWYPWSGVNIGKEKYIAMARHLRGIFDVLEVNNVRWVYSINWEDLPKENNSFIDYYPGDDYIDFVGIDGYNWGDTMPWSKWMSFKDIFDLRIKEVRKSINKDIIISEFSSASSGGDKAKWVSDAFDYIRKNKSIRAFVIFNVNKEAAWSFYQGEAVKKALKGKLKSSYFKESAL